MKWVKVDEMDFKDFIIVVNRIIIFIHFNPHQSSVKISKSGFANL